MTKPIRINNIIPNSIHWPNVAWLHVFHPIYGQLESINTCPQCQAKTVVWRALDPSAVIGFNMLKSVTGQWASAEFLVFAMEVIRLTDESERRHITFHVMPKVEGAPGGFQAIPYMTPPLVDEEIRLYRYYEQVIANQHRHNHTHKLIEEPTNGRPN